MSQKEILQKINKQIDLLIIDGKTDTSEYKRLIKLHYKITH